MADVYNGPTVGVVCPFTDDDPLSPLKNAADPSPRGGKGAMVDGALKKELPQVDVEDIAWEW